MSDAQMRLHRRIALSGLCSRRKAEELIAEGRVAVNGEKVTGMGVQVTDADAITVDGAPLPTPKVVTIALHKPTGIVTTLSDPHARRTVAEFIPPSTKGVKPVGRLDKETSGLLLLTSDGELAHRLAHPRYQIEKEYEAVVRDIPDEKALKRLRDGLMVEGKKTAPAQVSVLGTRRDGKTTTLRLVIHEGRKRQVRLMCEAVGHPVKTLHRSRVGPIILQGLPPGASRILSQTEMKNLKDAVGLK